LKHFLQVIEVIVVVFDQLFPRVLSELLVIEVVQNMVIRGIRAGTIRWLLVHAINTLGLL
jgi:hypothetical protein